MLREFPSIIESEIGRASASCDPVVRAHRLWGLIVTAFRASFYPTSTPQVPTYLETPYTLD